MLKQAFTYGNYHMAQHDAILSDLTEAEIRDDRRYHLVASAGAVGLAAAGVFLGDDVINMMPKGGNVLAAVRGAAMFANYMTIGAAVWLGSHHLPMAQNGSRELLDRSNLANQPENTELAA